ncbi:MAG: RNA polymerase sigma factor [Candidatus Aminicenantales bacterium]
MPEENDCSGKNKKAAISQFEALYLMYRKAVFSFAFYLTRNQSEAEDLFQEAWLRIIKNLSENPDLQSLRPWIFTIVSNLYRDQLRKKKIRKFFYTQRHSVKYQNSEPFTNISEKPIRKNSGETALADTGRDIAQAIARLPDRQRLVFLLKEMAGFQQAEISEIIGIPLGTVKSLIHRAVKRLRKELSAYNPKREKIKCGVKTLSF